MLITYLCLYIGKKNKELFQVAYITLLLWLISSGWSSGVLVQFVEAQLQVLEEESYYWDLFLTLHFPEETEAVEVVEAAEEGTGAAAFPQRGQAHCASAPPCF